MGGCDKGMVGLAAFDSSCGGRMVSLYRPSKGLGWLRVVLIKELRLIWIDLDEHEHALLCTNERS